MYCSYYYIYYPEYPLTLPIISICETHQVLQKFDRWKVEITSVNYKSVKIVSRTKLLI